MPLNHKHSRIREDCLLSVSISINRSNRRIYDWENAAEMVNLVSILQNIMIYSRKTMYTSPIETPSEFIYKR